MRHASSSRLEASNRETRCAIAPPTGSSWPPEESTPIARWRSRATTAVALASTFILLTGCNDSRFKEKEQQRYQRIDKLVYDYKLIESRRGQQIEWFFDVERKNESRRQAELEPQLHAIDARFHKDVGTTGDNLRELDEWSRGVLKGRLDAVPQYLVDVW